MISVYHSHPGWEDQSMLRFKKVKLKVSGGDMSPSVPLFPHCPKVFLWTCCLSRIQRALIHKGPYLSQRTPCDETTPAAPDLTSHHRPKRALWVTQRHRDERKVIPVLLLSLNLWRTRVIRCVKHSRHVLFLFVLMQHALTWLRIGECS